MQRTISVLLAVVALIGVACGGGDGGGNALCDDLRAKLDQCHIAVSGAQCDSGAAAEEKCDVQCIIDLPCNSLTDSTKQSPYLACQMTCAGMSEGFVCDDLSVFITKNSVCDGRPQCPDASDEANCGAGDAGGD